MCDGIRCDDDGSASTSVEPTEATNTQVHNEQLLSSLLSKNSNRIPLT